MKQCRGNKQKYQNKKQAKVAIRAIKNKYARSMHEYFCKKHNCWHLTSKKISTPISIILKVRID